MFNFLKKIKKINRNRIVKRRNLKFETTLNNSFDKSSLQLNNLLLLTKNTDKYFKSTKNSLSFAVYTSYFGTLNAKTLNNKNITSEIDHYFISNNRDILNIVKNKGWNPIFLDLPISQNKILSAHQAKIPKSIPHFFPSLNKYDFLLYVDDKIDFNLTSIKNIIKMSIEMNQSILIREHQSIKNNILNEFAAAMLQPRYQAQKDQIIEFIEEQIRNGLKLRVNHLFWTSAILRNMNHKDTNLISEDWYQEILNCGIECQISFDFIAQKYNTIGILPETLFDND